ETIVVVIGVLPSGATAPGLARAVTNAGADPWSWLTASMAPRDPSDGSGLDRSCLDDGGISYHPQSGWFEDTPLKGGPEEGCPLKGVHEGIFLLRLGSMCGTTFELLSSHRGIVCPLAVALRIALGVVVVLEAGLSHKTSSAPPQRR